MEIVTLYKNELKRIAWRLQYKARVLSKRECRSIEDITPHYHTSKEVDNLILIQELLGEIPTNMGRRIIKDLFIKDYSEAQLAKELNMSQQAVNKWKRKTLNLLSQKVNFWTY
ncbi:sigma-70 family RNA polymerase sigma factor [Alkalihalobacillus trypoxylicola]|uniref:RNA polymerase sigma-70 region 4 domain-containing protein n=1 Tax=Alkalihalobacillus trypoxylicola TaxID=519424 RepID=A0A162DFZ0_9BACI|nr:sigma-70 family RNA polymerase sigma factor [Alkalihalobacillus trypoxylicola]KYG29504.1 hypothetical protein AZF04_08260 [Alkalihalobacillus trypoxylicola]